MDQKDHAENKAYDDADHIQPRLKVQLGAVQSAKGGAHLLDLQGITSLSYMVHVAG